MLGLKEFHTNYMLNWPILEPINTGGGQASDGCSSSFLFLCLSYMLAASLFGIMITEYLLLVCLPVPFIGPDG